MYFFLFRKTFNPQPITKYSGSKKSIFSLFKNKSAIFLSNSEEY